MRGKAVACRVSSSGHGITPAYAGKSLAFSAFSARELGSPPHMRGKVTSAFFVESRTGITPAYAGKSSFFCPSGSTSKDHPRICGEKQLLLSVWQHLKGSPPHMRGKEPLAAWVLKSLGITPAYAGKRWGCVTGGSGCWDHPRICGEKRQLNLADSKQPGSPPHMRGKGVQKSYARVTVRITPAYAGKSCTSCSWWPRSQDHPRVCGEKCLCPTRTTQKLGSPPRMRGKEPGHL